jgi:hypothetical protein
MLNAATRAYRNTSQRRREAVERQATGGAPFDKIEFDRGRSMRCPIRISVRRGEYPPRFRSTKCMMFARCRARRASASLYPIASYGELSVCIPLSLLQMGRVVYSERVQITFGEKTMRIWRLFLRCWGSHRFLIAMKLSGGPSEIIFDQPLPFIARSFCRTLPR